MLRSLKKSLIILLFVPLLACAEESAVYKEGEHYKTLSKPVATDAKGKIEVVELFWYGCPHCYSLEPLVEKWASTLPQHVVFKRMPAMMASHWEVNGRAYYAAEILGVAEQTHQKLFDAIHRQGQKIFDQESLADFYASQGVDKVEFNKAFNSFLVSSRVQQAKQRQRGYQATGVPAVVVNGKYLVSTTMKAGGDGLFDVVDFLIEKERKTLD